MFVNAKQSQPAKRKPKPGPLGPYRAFPCNWNPCPTGYRLIQPSAPCTLPFSVAASSPAAKA